MTPHTALILDRFMLSSALSVVWGGLGFTHLASATAKDRLHASMRGPVLLASMIAAMAALAAVPIQTAEFGSGWSAPFEMNMVLAVMLQTDLGISIGIEAVTTLALVVATIKDRTTASILLAGLALAEIATRGHSAASLDGPGLVRVTVMAVHVLSAAAWVGALIPFLLLLRVSSTAVLRTDAVASMMRFSRLGHVAVALVILTGMANTALILGHLPWGGGSRYQAALLLKAALVAAMAALALANRYLLVPLSAHHPDLSRMLLAVGSGLEICLGLVAFALVASFGLDDPTT